MEFQQYIVSTILTLTLVIAILTPAKHTYAHQTFLIIGVAGVGKSTLANCIINKSPDLDLIREYPFVTSDSACGCTRNFQITFDNYTKVIDTIGFGDPELNQTSVLLSLRTALATEDYRIDAVLFVIKQERFRNETVEFFKLMQDEVLRGKTKRNSILICNGCQKGWLETERRTNEFLNKALINCNNVSYEFNLVFNEPNVTVNQRSPAAADQLREVLKKTYTNMRNRSIIELNRFLAEQKFTKVDLSHVKDAKFLRATIKLSRTFGKGLYVTGLSSFGLGMVGLSVCPIVGCGCVETLGVIKGVGMVAAGIGFVLSSLVKFVTLPLDLENLTEYPDSFLTDFDEEEELHK